MYLPHLGKYTSEFSTGYLKRVVDRFKLNYLATIWPRIKGYICAKNL